MIEIYVEVEPGHRPVHCFLLSCAYLVTVAHRIFESKLTAEIRHD